MQHNSSYMQLLASAYSEPHTSLQYFLSLVSLICSLRSCLPCILSHFAAPCFCAVSQACRSSSSAVLQSILKPYASCNIGCALLLI